MVRVLGLAVSTVALAVSSYIGWLALSPQISDGFASLRALTRADEDSRQVVAPASASPGGPTLIKPPTLVRGPETGIDRKPNVVTVRSDAPLLRSRQAGAADRHGDRYELARSIQRELVRVGCYGSDPDGDWGGATKRAMQAFLDRMNASLPVDEPDGVLLAIVQSQKVAVCADTCRTGEVIGSNGRCIPTGLVAQRVQSRPAGAGVTAMTAVSAPALKPSSRAATATPWRTDVASAEVRSPVQAQIAQPPAQQTVAASVPAPLPATGRMALGVGAPSATLDLAPASPSLAPGAIAQPPGPAPAPKAAGSPLPPPPKPKSKSQPAWARSVFPQVFFDR